MDLTLMFKQAVADVALHLTQLDAGMLQPEACAQRIKQSCDRWVTGFVGSWGCCLP